MKKLCFAIILMIILAVGVLGAQESQNPFLNTTWVVDVVGGREPMAFEFYDDGTYKQSESLVYADLQATDSMRYRIDVDNSLIELELQPDLFIEWRYEFGMEGQRYFDLYLSNTQNPLALQFFGEFERSLSNNDYNDVTQEFFGAITEAMKDVVLEHAFMRGFEPAG